MPRINKKTFLLFLIIIIFILIITLLLARKKKVPAIPVKTPAAIPTATPTIEQLLNEQTKDDLEFAQKTKEGLEKYPFVKRLPINNSKYVIVFDSELKIIRVYLKTVTQEEIQGEVEQILKEIKVDTKLYPVEYSY